MDVGKKKRERKKRKRERKKEKKRKKKKETVAKKKVWKRFGCLIFEQKFKAVRGVFWENCTAFGDLPEDSPLNSEHFDI